MKYYEVVPLSYIGGETEKLTYSSDQPFVTGQAVVVPVRNRKATGVILGMTKKPGFAVKPIERVIFENPVISEKYLEIARFIADYYGCALTSVLQTMLPKGLAKKRRTVKDTDNEHTKSKRLKLTKEQQTAYDSILSAKENKPHLLFGVTGSGKTEVFLQLAEKTLAENKQVIILVPEVSLIPQMADNFRARFGDTVAVYHSYLKETERFRAWLDILEGRRSIVIGSRSALFAPLPDPGLIVIDEEHETSYKQDQSPRYHARHIAVKIAEKTGAKLVLASATPSIESYARATAGKYYLHVLTKRIVQDGLPEVTVADMRDEFKKQNYSIFSDVLRDQIRATLTDNKQVLLFLNRRGMATFVNCRDCGYIAECPSCDLPLTFHYHDLNLVCHHCNFKSGLPSVCPVCHGVAVKYFGSGTEKVEVEIKKIFGDKVRVERMDRDTTQKRDSHTEIFTSFANKNIDILIGTQMITKGWDLPGVGLVGIVSADTMINFPDFSASERTFDLLTQVAGRTGRGYSPGKVVLQTYSPDHPAIRAAQKHDFATFYRYEMKNRKSLGYPPFAHLIKIMYNNIAQTKAERTVCNFAEILSHDFPDISIIGPSPAFRPKVAGKYRWQLILKVSGKTETEFIELVTKIRKMIDDNWMLDVDPVSTL